MNNEWQKEITTYKKEKHINQKLDAPKTSHLEPTSWSPPPHVSNYNQDASRNHFKVTSNNHPLLIDSGPDEIICGR